MSKTLKRTLAVVMAIAMIFSLSATAFADNDDITVYVTIQSATVAEGDSWDYTLGTLYVTNTYATAIPVCVQPGSTVKDVADAIANCTWQQVENMVYDENTGTYVGTGTYSYALYSLQYGSYPTLINNGSSVDNLDGTYTYTGTSWEYFTAPTSGGTNIYPNYLYMSQYYVSNGEYITLSFDSNSFTY